MARGTLVMYVISYLATNRLPSSQPFYLWSHTHSIRVCVGVNGTYHLRTWKSIRDEISDTVKMLSMMLPKTTQLSRQIWSHSYNCFPRIRELLFSSWLLTTAAAIMEYRERKPTPPTQPYFTHYLLEWRRPLFPRIPLPIPMTYIEIRHNYQYTD